MAMNTTAAPAQTTTVVVTQPVGAGGGDPALEQYYQESATRCFLNQSCNCCTCRCCAFCIAICWAISGAIGAYNSSVGLGYVGETEACPTTSAYTGDCCCYGDESACVYFEADLCGTLRTAYTLDMVQSILCCIAGTCGVIGLAMFISWLLLVPMGYSVISVILSIVGAALLVGEFGVLAVSGNVIGIGIAICLAILFWTNYKLIKDILKK